jgi:rod shape-determining protein MreC
MGVISPAGVVGQVIKTTSSTAMVLLLSDPNVAVTAMIQRTRDEGIVQGTAQGLVRMKYIPPLSPVEINDIVVTSGLTENFPRGLQIGSIRRLEKADADLFQSAEIQPIVDFSRLEGVLVITSLGLALESPALSLSPPTQPDLVR